MKTGDPDAALQRLNELRKSELSKISAADTRAKLIDPLFKEALGWSEDDIVRETHIHQGCIDYIFSVDRVRKFVPEAPAVRVRGKDLPTRTSLIRSPVDYQDIFPWRRLSIS